MIENLPSYFIGATINSSLLFLALTAIIILHAIYSRNFTGVAKTKLATFILLVLIGWFSGVFYLGKTGFFFSAPLFAPNIALAFLLLFIVLKPVYKAVVLQRLARAMSMPWVIGIQTYRIVGYGFLSLYELGLLPGIFAFPSGIGDMIVGFSAPFVALLYFFKKSGARKLAIAWNIVGIADLLMAISLGTLAFQRPIQILPTAVSTGAMSLFPLVLITLFAVPLALLLHLFSLRVLLKGDV